MAVPEKRRDADRSRAAILDAAESLFAERGFDAVTMAQIGAAAGVSRGTPGYFFGTKDALYRVVMERAAVTLRMLAETLRARDGAGTRSREMVVAETVDAFLGLLIARRSVVRLLARDATVVEGVPHADTLAVALAGLGSDAPRTALTILSLCWFPVSQPDAARRLGVDPDAPDFHDRWRAVVLGAVGEAPVAALISSAPAGAEASPAIEDEEPRKKKKKAKKGKKKLD